MSQPSVAVAIPAYNEADGIGGFIREIDKALAPSVEQLWLIVVDDASTDDTRGVLESLASELEGTLEVVTNAENRGHGPSVMAGYPPAPSCGPDFLLAGGG